MFAQDWIEQDVKYGDRPGDGYAEWRYGDLRMEFDFEKSQANTWQPVDCSPNERLMSVVYEEAMMDVDDMCRYKIATHELFTRAVSHVYQKLLDKCYEIGPARPTPWQ